MAQIAGDDDGRWLSEAARVAERLAVGVAHEHVPSRGFSCRLEVELPITHNAVHFLGGYA